MGIGKSWSPIQKCFCLDRGSKNSIGPTAKLFEALGTGQNLGPIQNYNFLWAQISTVLTWVRKNLSSSMFWWGILRKSSIPTTSNRSLPGLTKEDGDSIKFGPHPKVEFSMGLKAHSVHVSQTERYGAQCCGEASGARVPAEQHVIFRCKS